MKYSPHFAQRGKKGCSNARSAASRMLPAWKNSRADCSESANLPLWRWIEFPEGKSGFSRFFLPFPPAPAFQMSSLNVQKRVREHSMFSATRHDASIRSTSLGNYRYSRKCTKIQGWRILTNIINVIINEISLEELINIFFTTLMNLVKFYRRIFNYSTVEFYGKL